MTRNPMTLPSSQDAREEEPVDPPPAALDEDRAWGATANPSP